MTGPEHSRAKRRCPSGADVMANGQKVDHSGSTLQKLFELYRQAELCDIHLQVGGRLFPAHKLILSMSSDVFKTMLTDAKWPDARKACIMLNEEPECVQVFGEFLQYMYTGNIHLNNSSVLPVLTLADKYNIHDLGKVCRQYMACHCHASLPNLKVVSWLQYAILCNDKELEKTLRRYVVLNLNHVMQSEDFVTIRQETLEEVVNCPHLVIHSEYTLFLGLKTWILHNTGTATMCEQNKDRGTVESPSGCSSAETSQITEKPPVHPSKVISGTERRKPLHLMSHIRLPLIKYAHLLILQSDPFVRQHANLFQPQLQALLSASSGRHPPCKKGRDVHGPAHDTNTPGSRNAQCQGSRMSRTVIHHISSGSRTVYRRNSDTSIVSGCSSSSQEQSQVQTSGLCVTAISGNADCEEQSESLSCATCSSNCDEGLLYPEDAMPLHTHPQVHRVTAPTKASIPLCQPRNYTCDDWSTCLAIESFADFPRYGSHTYFFSTPSSAVPLSTSFSNCCCNGYDTDDETDDAAMLEWQAELYPKGVHFPRAKMIGIPHNYDIDENCQEVVRLAINSKTQHEQPCRVDITVLTVALGKEDGSEYMETLAHKSCIFDKDHTMHNIDNIVPLHELSQPDSKYLTESARAPGTGRTCFKVVVIIKPSV